VDRTVTTLAFRFCLLYYFPCRQQAQDQYQKYVNRYGSGMVIYWFGVVEELALAAESNITLVSELPLVSEIIALPSITVPKL
jgi:hypothetical protein